MFWNKIVKQFIINVKNSAILGMYKTIIYYMQNNHKSLQYKYVYIIYLLFNQYFKICNIS